MSLVNSKEIYNRLKVGDSYQEEYHCPLIIKIMNDFGTMSAFCKEAGISDTTFYKWTYKHPMFQESYRVGCMIARENWEEEGRAAVGNPDFNIRLWEMQGAARYGVGKTNRVRVHIDSHTTPYHQYQQLLNQASMGDFTASEFKQLVEGVNVGIRAYESFELQREVDAMKNDLSRMNQQHGNNIVPIANVTKAN